jgi:hypothetical protein
MASKISGLPIAEAAIALAQWEAERVGASTHRTFLSALAVGLGQKGVEVSSLPVFQGIRKAAARRLALEPPKPAVAAEPHQVAQLIRQPSREATVVEAMWATASRFSDFRHARLNQSNASISLALHKGDPLGRLGAVKFFGEDQLGVMSRALHLVQQEEITYKQMYNYIRRIQPGLTVHSIRRGALTTLSDDHEVEELQLMGTHASPQSSRRYIHPKRHQREPSRMIAMSNQLMSSLNAGPAPLRRNW